MIVEGFHDDQNDTDIAIEADGTVFVRGDVIAEDTFQSAVEAYSEIIDSSEAHRAKEALQSVASEMAYEDDVFVVEDYHCPLIVLDLEADHDAPRFIKDYQLDGLVLRHVATHHDRGERSEATRSSSDSSGGGFDVEPPFLTFEIDRDEWGSEDE